MPLPTYKRFDGPKPDLARVHPLMPDCFYRFPAHPARVTDGVPGDGKDVSGSAPTSNPIPPTADRNPYWQELNRRLGLPPQLTITSATDYPNKFATAVAGDTLGDLFNVDSGFAYLPQFLEARGQDLTEYLSGDAILEYPFLANLATDAWRGCVYSGGIRAVPIQRGVMSSNLLLARQDLLDQFGVELGSPDVDELVKVAKAVTDEKKNPGLSPSHRRRPWPRCCGCRTTGRFATAGWCTAGSCRNTRRCSRSPGRWLSTG